MSIILHKLRERNGPANDIQKWPNSFHWPQLLLHRPFSQHYFDICQYMLCWCWYAIFNLVCVRNFYCSCYLCYESQWGSLKTSEQLNLSNCSQNILFFELCIVATPEPLLCLREALNGTYLMSRICIKHSSILLSWLHPWSIRNFGNLKFKYNTSIKYSVASD